MPAAEEGCCTAVVREELHTQAKSRVYQQRWCRRETADGLRNSSRMSWYWVQNHHYPDTAVKSQMTPERVPPPVPAGLRWSAATSAFRSRGRARRGMWARSIWDDFLEKHGADHRRIDGGSGLRQLSASRSRCGPSPRGWDSTAIGSRSLGRRVQPDGRGVGDKTALDHYSRLVDLLLEAGVAPFPTLFHWEMPSAVEADRRLARARHRRALRRLRDDCGRPPR